MCLFDHDVFYSLASGGNRHWLNLTQFRFACLCNTTQTALFALKKKPAVIVPAGAIPVMINRSVTLRHRRDRVHPRTRTGHPWLGRQ